MPVDAIASVLCGLNRRFWVPFGATLLSLPLPGILRDPMDIAFESLGDLASNVVKLFDNWIKSPRHRRPPQACPLVCKSLEKEEQNHPRCETREAGS
jgi:hypothetical protein